MIKEVRPSPVAENLKVVIFLELGIKAFSAVVARLLGGAHAAAAILLWAAGWRPSCRRIRQHHPTVVGLSACPSNVLTGRDDAHATHAWCRRHMLGGRPGWGSTGRLLEGGDNRGGELIRTHRLRLGNRRGRRTRWRWGSLA